LKNFFLEKNQFFSRFWVLELEILVFLGEYESYYITQKYDLRYQSCAISNQLRNNRFSRSEILKLVFVVNIAIIGLIFKQINTETL